MEPKLRNAVGGGEQCADDGTPMAVVAATVSVGDESGAEVVVVFPSKVEGGGKGVGDVAGGAEDAADDDFIRLGFVGQGSPF